MTEAQTALAELLEISSQIEAAVLFGSDGTVVATTLPEDRAARLAAGAGTLLEEAGSVGAGEPTHLEAATAEGSLFVLRDGDLLIAASTSTEPTAGLVFYDLRACLRRAAAKPKPKRRARAKTRGTP